MTTPSNSQTLVGVVECKAIEDKPKLNSVSAWCFLQWRAILVEFVSTMCLLLFGCMSCIPVHGLTEQSPLFAPLGFGLTVMFNIIIFGHISGAHMNPAVTLSSIIWGSMSISLGICYVIVQCLGATVGYGILIALSPINLADEGTCVTLPHPGSNEFQVFGIEIGLTAILCLVCCAFWDPVNKLQQETVPIKFGLVIVGLCILGGHLTGASMNPARTMGPAVWTGIWTAHWAYWAGPLFGSAFATFAYKFVLYKKDVTH